MFAVRLLAIALALAQYVVWRPITGYLGEDGRRSRREAATVGQPPQALTSP